MKRQKTNDFLEMVENTRVELQSWKAVKRAFLSLENEENADFVAICKHYFSVPANEKAFRMELCEKADKMGRVSPHRGKIIINRYIKGCLSNDGWERMPIAENLRGIRKIYFAKRIEKQNKANAEK